MENTKIEWATHTFNPWEGCAKVSPGCKNCYAEGQHKLHHAALGKGDNPGTCWGVGAPRLGKSEDNWKKPLRWNREAAAAGVRARVFCASMADVFEPQSVLSASFAGQTGTVPTGGDKTRTVRFVDLGAERLRLLRLIYDTPHLDWLLLTKRPENIRPALMEVRMAAVRAGESEVLDGQVRPFYRWLVDWACKLIPPANVWLGTSVENQEQADIRVPQLLAAPAAVRFLSCEPLLGPVDLKLSFCTNCFDFTKTIEVNSGKDWGCAKCRTYKGSYKGRAWKPSGKHCGIDWVIVGGESGPRARAMHPLWAESLRDQCQAAGVAFHFKQWGEYEHFCMTFATEPTGEPTKFFVFPDGYAMRRVGKHEAGRLLDGRTWDELPQVRKEPQP